MTVGRPIHRVEKAPNPSTSLREGVKDFWGDGLREKVLKLVKRVWGRVLVEEAKGVVGCGRYKRSNARQGYRNGFYERGLLTEYGWIEEIKVPRVRNVSWRPSVWSRYQQRHKALDRVILESFLLGHSTRKAVRIFKRVFKGLISAQTVSNIVRLLDGEVEAFRRRRFEKRYRVLIIDGLWIKVASPFPVWKVVLVALGVREDGEKELLSFQVVPSEKECCTDRRHG
jgi:putative transposase